MLPSMASHTLRSKSIVCSTELPWATNSMEPAHRFQMFMHMHLKRETCYLPDIYVTFRIEVTNKLSWHLNIQYIGYIDYIGVFFMCI
jgi:hypothetical protein